MDNPSLPCSSPDNPIIPLAEFDAAFWTVPFSRSAGNLGETDAVQMEPFPVALFSSFQMR